MTVSEKIKTFNTKIVRNKDQYNFDKKTTKISALSSGYFIKYKFLAGKDVLLEKDLLEKAAALKKFLYLPLGSVAEK